MKKLKKNIASSILRAINSAFAGADTPSEAEIVSMLEYPPDETMGDLAFPCFKLSRALRKAPPVIAAEVAKAFECDGVEKCEVAGGYLNFRISNSYYAALAPRIIAEGGEYGRSHVGDGKTVVLDYSAPNISKPFHIGHLASTVIGHSLKMIHAFSGYNCVGINHLGDWGTQFGKQILAYKLWGDKETVERGGVDELVRLYVKFHAEAENDDSLNTRAREEFTKLEHGDEENTALWRWFVKISLDECNRTYDKLGITFDSYAGESFYTDKMPEQVEKLKESGLLKVDNGASIVDLSEYNMPPCLILKSDGSSLYATRDIAAAEYRHKTYGFYKCLYVVAYQQNLHFKQFFKVLELMGREWAKDLVHVAYGMVSLESGAMSTREGNVVLLEDVLNKTIEKAREVIEEKNPDIKDKENTAKAVGTGAVIFGALVNNKIKDIVFSYDRVLSFEGETCPYVQYTVARCNSVIKKVGMGGDYAVPDMETSEYQVVSELGRFSEVLVSASEKYEPSFLTRYCIDLAKAYNKFYIDCKIATDDINTRNFRLAVTRAVKTTLTNALDLLGIKTVAEM